VSKYRSRIDSMKLGSATRSTITNARVTNENHGDNKYFFI